MNIALRGHYKLSSRISSTQIDSKETARKWHAKRQSELRVNFAACFLKINKQLQTSFPLKMTSGTKFCAIAYIIAISNGHLLGPWIQPESPTFPSEKYSSQVIGYESITERIWLIGGFITKSAPTSKTVHSFNVQSHTFTAHNTISDPVIAGAQTYTQHNDTIYMIWDDRSTNAISTFNMNSQEFISKLDGSTLPIYIYLEGSLTFHDGYLLVTGGRTNASIDGIAHNRFQIFHISDALWSEGPELPQNRNRHTSAVVDYYLYVIGGSTNIVIRIYVVDLENISNYKWETLNDTLSVQYIIDIYMRSVVYQSSIFVLGGYDAPIDVIHTASLTITRNISTLISNVRRATVVVAHDMIYVFGGWCGLCNGSAQTPVTYQYAPLWTLNPTVEPTNIPSPDPTVVPTTNPTEVIATNVMEWNQTLGSIVDGINVNDIGIRNDADQIVFILGIIVGILLVLVCCGSYFVYQSRRTDSVSDTRALAAINSNSDVRCHTNELESESVLDAETRTVEGIAHDDVDAKLLTNPMIPLAICQVNEEPNCNRTETVCSEELFGDENNVPEQTNGAQTPGDFDTDGRVSCAKDLSS